MLFDEDTIINTSDFYELLENAPKIILTDFILGKVGEFIGGLIDGSEFLT